MNLFKWNVTSTTFSQQILSDMFILVVTGRQKNNLRWGFKLELKCNNLLSMICGESAVKML